MNDNLAPSPAVAELNRVLRGVAEWLERRKAERDAVDKADGELAAAIAAQVAEYEGGQ
jgi:hypothetical protein